MLLIWLFNTSYNYFFYWLLNNSEWFFLSLSLWFEQLWAFCRKMQNRHKAGKKKKTQLGTQIADASCVQRQIKTAGPLQRDVIWSITVLSFNKKHTHIHVFKHTLRGMKNCRHPDQPETCLFINRSRRSFDTTTSNKLLQLTVSNKSTGDDWLPVKHRFDWCPLGWVWVHFLSFSLSVRCRHFTSSILNH